MKSPFLRRFLAAIGFVGAAFCCSPASATLIFFDGFESPSQSGGYSYDGVSGAGAVFGPGTGLQANGSAFGYTNAPEGVQTAHIQSNGSFTETVSGLIAGQLYELSFAYALRPNYLPDGLSVTYNSNPLFNSTAPSFAFTAVYLTFVADSTAALFTFAGVPATAGDTNVAVDAVALAAVPGPIVGAGLPGLAMAIGGLIVFSRRRRNQAAVG
jgi:hypothetical protein